MQSKSGKPRTNQLIFVSSFSLSSALGGKERERERKRACFPHSRPADGLEKRDPGKENVRLVLKAHGHGCSFFFFCDITLD